MLESKVRITTEVSPSVWREFKNEVQLRRNQNTRTKLTIATEVNEALIIYTTMSKENKLGQINRPIYDFSKLSLEQSNEEK